MKHNFNLNYISLLVYFLIFFIKELFGVFLYIKKKIHFIKNYSLKKFILYKFNNNFKISKNNYYNEYLDLNNKKWKKFKKQNSRKKI